MVIKLLFVGLGGFVGASLRYLTGIFIGLAPIESNLPLGTFAVNIIGSLLIGFLAGLAESQNLLNDTARAFVFTGMLGAFTTFSTFSYETMGLFQNGQTSPALANLGLQITLGLAAVWGGIQIARLV
ncbi:MAG TPA: fluoride efflux transporter CrcB [Anaerolineales bacterium]|nr:fluoride efflux transporter CrcB [Anaerolineales bacterium]